MTSELEAVTPLPDEDSESASDTEVDTVSPADYEAIRTANIERNRAFLRSLSPMPTVEVQKKRRKRKAPREAPSAERQPQKVEQRDLRDRLPHREVQIAELRQALCATREFERPILVSGPAASGKVSVVRGVLEDLCAPRDADPAAKVSFALLNSTAPRKSLFASLLWQLQRRTQTSSEALFVPKVPVCNSAAQLQILLEDAFSTHPDENEKIEDEELHARTAVDAAQLFLVFRNAEQLSPGTLESFMALQCSLLERRDLGLGQLRLPIVRCIFISQSNLFAASLQGWFPKQLHFPRYTQEETAFIVYEKVRQEQPELLRSDKSGEDVLARVLKQLVGTPVPPASSACEKETDDAPGVAWAVCNDLRLLLRLVVKVLPTALETPKPIDFNSQHMESINKIEKPAAPHLPFAVKFLLIAAFIASRNPPETDWQIFVPRKNGNRRKRKRRQKSSSKTKGCAALSFSLERLLAIYQALLGAEMGRVHAQNALDAEMQAQLASLVTMGLLLIPGSQVKQPEDPHTKTMQLDPTPFGLGLGIQFNLGSGRGAVANSVVGFLHGDILLRYGGTEDLAFRMAKTLDFKLGVYLLDDV